MSVPNFGEILEKFVSMHEEQSKRTDELIIKSDEKIDALSELVSQLAHSRIEARKDREFDTVRMERIETNQKDQGTALKAVSDTMILVNERVNGNRGKWMQLGSVFFAIVTSVVSAVLITKVV